MIATPAPRSNPHPWCVVRKLPKMQRIVVARFHRRTDAEGYLQILRRMLPTTTHEIVFEPVVLSTVQSIEIATLSLLSS